MHLSHALSDPKKDSFVAIQELPPSVNNDRAQTESFPPNAWYRKLAKHVRRFTWRFFPFIGEPPPDHLDGIHKQPSFPWLGLLCLLIAISTLAFSFTIFKIINDEPQIENQYLKPASWLSALISINSIALHIALSEGVTTAWWYKASRRDVTLKELHETWIMGTSTVAVLLAGKSFNYVAMATIFVATVPLNGFLLQNAISVYSDTKSNGTTLHIPIAQQIPMGFSAEVINGTIEQWTPDLTWITSGLDGLGSTMPPGVFSIYGPSYDGSFLDLGCENVDHSAVCKAPVTMAGFSMNCTTEMVEPYDLRPSQHTNESAYRVTVFSSSVGWNASKPNVIELDMLWKPNSTCQGFFERKKCRLEAASMSIPIQINSDRGFNVGTDYEGVASSNPVISLDANYTQMLQNFERLGPLPIYADEGKDNSTFGGIAQWLGQKYNGSIDWTLRNGTWSTNRTGSIANSYTFNTYLTTETMGADGNISYEYADFTPKPNNVSWCNNTYSGLDTASESYSVDPVTTMFFTANKVMLGASVSAFKLSQTATDSLMNVTDAAEAGKLYAEAWRQTAFTATEAKQTQAILRYDIRYGYWGASVAVTMLVVLMIVPLFYGFWHLDHRATLSPFETAAAFNAPGLHDADMKKGTAVLLKEIGTRPVHVPGSDLASASFENRSQEGCPYPPSQVESPGAQQQIEIQKKSKRERLAGAFGGV